MNLRKIKSVIGVLCALCLVVSCTQTEEPQSKSTLHSIEFASNGITSRSEGSPDANYELLPDGSSLGVLAYHLSDGVFDETINHADLLYNAKVNKLAMGLYEYNPMVNWPDMGKVKFFAYYPHSSMYPNGAILLSPYVLSGYPTVTIDLLKARGRVDFAVAELGALSPRTGSDPVGTPPRQDYMVNFRFKRRLSELFFRARAVDLPPLVNLYIHSISVKNASISGQYNFKTDAWTPSVVDASSGATLAFSSTGVPVDKDEYMDVINPENKDGKNRKASVVMIPNQYSVVKLRVVYTVEYMKPEGGCEYRVVGSRDIPFAVDWKPATMYTYNVEASYHQTAIDSAKFTFNVIPWKTETVNTEMN